MKSIVYIYLFLLMISGCTPLASRPDSDFEWEKQSFNQGYQEVYRNLREGFRRCDLYHITSDLYTDKKNAYIEVYGKTLLFGGNSGLGVGLIYINSNDEFNTEVKLAKFVFASHLPKWITAFVKRDYSFC